MELIKNSFVEAVDDISPKYLDEFGIKLSKDKGWSAGSFSGDNGYLRLGIYREYNGGIDINLGTPTSKGHGYVGISLYWILLATAPEQQFISCHTKTNDDIRNELERQFQLLVKYCRPLLEGDESAWSKVFAFMSEFKPPKDPQLFDQWILVMKEKAAKAFQAENFILANQIYLNLTLVQRQELTIEEKQQHDYVRKHVEKQMKSPCH